MKNIILAAIDDIKSGNNLDLYLTVVIAVIIAFLGAFSIAKQEIISSAILATLAILAFGSIQDRRERVIIRSALKEGSADSFFRKHSFSELEKLIETVKNSKSAFFWGIHFRKTVDNWNSDLQQALRNGTYLRFLLVKPESSAVAMSLLRYNLDSTQDNINHDIESVLRKLAYIGISSNAIDRIEVRVIDFMPPYTMISINPLSSNGKMYVLLSSIRTPTRQTPSFQISAEKDKSYFDFFVDQFEKAWKEGDVIDLQRHTIYEP